MIFFIFMFMCMSCGSVLWKSTGRSKERSVVYFLRVDSNPKMYDR